MGNIELILMAVALAMDAFAVAICKGLAMPRVTVRGGAAVGLWFGGFQAIMPLLGYLLGVRFEQYIVAVDHWIAFVLLALIGANMLREALKGGDDDSGDSASLAVRTMLPLAVATSIDALAIGVTLAILRADIVLAVSVIGAVTFAISFAGVKIGSVFGARFKKPAEIAGGVVLILIGVKILLEHLDIISF